MKPSDIIFVTSLTVLLVLVAYAQGAPPRDQEFSSQDIDEPSIARWILEHFADYERAKRPQLDAGFLSRHSALTNFLNSYDAKHQVNDPFGPGKRK